MKKNNVTIIVALVCAAACVAGVIVMSRTMPDQIGGSDTTVLLESTDTVTTDSGPAETEGGDIETKPPYVSPIDFAALEATAPHVHGWLRIENSYIDYPVVQHPSDDKFYDRKTHEGVDDVKGSIYTEHVYNRTDFCDPVTVMYGHYVGTKGNYEFFGGLQEMYSPENYENYKNITIYREGKELRYEFYASVRYDKEHIPWTYDFSDPESYNAFLARVKSFEGPDGVIRSDVEVTPEDRLIVLSTCFDGGYGANKDVRYIVIARLVEIVK